MILFRSEIKPNFLLMKHEIDYQKVSFYCQPETNHILNENFSFPKHVVPFQKRELLAYFEMEFFKKNLSVHLKSFFHKHN